MALSSRYSGVFTLAVGSEPSRVELSGDREWSESRPMILRTSYAMPGTDIAYAPTPLLRDARY
eukprot:1360439-Rhodomonas_salina.1